VNYSGGLDAASLDGSRFISIDFCVLVSNRAGAACTHAYNCPMMRKIHPHRHPCSQFIGPNAATAPNRADGTRFRSFRLLPYRGFHNHSNWTSLSQLPLCFYSNHEPRVKRRMCMDSPPLHRFGRSRSALLVFSKMSSTRGKPLTRFGPEPPNKSPISFWTASKFEYTF
jgi:hypothetical protein